MIDLVSEKEALPSEYPDIGEASEHDKAMVWQRIESYIAYRWQERDIEFILEGQCEWMPRLAPLVNLQAQIWKTDGWQDTNVLPTPYGGFIFVEDGQYKVTGKAGDNSEMPASVIEAANRLFGFLNREAVKKGVYEYEVNVEVVVHRTKLAPNSVARALQISGAADLLRPYRRF